MRRSRRWLLNFRLFARMLSLRLELPSGLAVANVHAFMCAILHAAARAFEFLRGVCHREFAKESLTELGV
jgi:hypothetical protein